MKALHKPQKNLSYLKYFLLKNKTYTNLITLNYIIIINIVISHKAPAKVEVCNLRRTAVQNFAYLAP